MSGMVGAKPRTQASPLVRNGSIGICAWMLPALEPDACVLSSKRSTSRTSTPSRAR